MKTDQRTNKVHIPVIRWDKRLPDVANLYFAEVSKDRSGYATAQHRLTQIFYRLIQTLSKIRKIYQLITRIKLNIPKVFWFSGDGMSGLRLNFLIRLRGASGSARLPASQGYAVTRRRDKTPRQVNFRKLDRFEYNTCFLFDGSKTVIRPEEFSHFSFELYLTA